MRKLRDSPTRSPHLQSIIGLARKDKSLKNIWIWLGLGVLGLVLCLLVTTGGVFKFLETAGTPSSVIAVGAMLFAERFDGDLRWDTFNDPSQGVDFQIEDGVYRVQVSRPLYAWAMGSQFHSDVVIDVEVTQRSTYANNAYGVICRADGGNGGDGYYFLISGEGYFTIRRGVEGGGGAVRALVGWTRSSAVQAGGFNRLRAVCVGDYLALYINGQFVGETRDTLLQRGFVALAGAVAGDTGTLRAEFDNLTIYEGSIE